MSQENVDLTKASYEAWNAGDMDALREMHDPEVTARYPREWPEPGPFVGRDVVMRQLEQLREPGTPMQRNRSSTSSTPATESS